MYEYRSKVIKIIDGDTVDVDIDLGFDVVLSNQRIRLKGVDTPESRTSDKEEKKYGLLAKRFVESYLTVGNYYTLTTTKDAEGKYGRILGDFIVYDGHDDRWSTLCTLLIESHNAVPYVGQSKEDIAEQHLENRKYIDEQIKMAGQ